MHDHQRIACSSVAELLQKVVEDIVVSLHECVGFGGEQVVEQPRPLKETDKFVDTCIMAQVGLRNFWFPQYDRMKYEHSTVWRVMRSTMTFMDAMSFSSTFVRNVYTSSIFERSA